MLQFGHAITIRFTQRMLRKGEQNILTEVRRQVYQIVRDWRPVLAFERNQRVIGIHVDLISERPKTADAWPAAARKPPIECQAWLSDLGCIPG